MHMYASQALDSFRCVTRILSCDSPRSLRIEFLILMTARPARQTDQGTALFKETRYDDVCALHRMIAELGVAHKLERVQIHDGRVEDDHFRKVCCA